MMHVTVTVATASEDVLKAGEWVVAGSWWWGGARLCCGWLELRVFLGGARKVSKIVIRAACKVAKIVAVVLTVCCPSIGRRDCVGPAACA